MNCIKNAYQESHMCDGRNVADVNNNDVSDGNKEPCEAVNAIQLKIWNHSNKETLIPVIKKNKILKSNLKGFT